MTSEPVAGTVEALNQTIRCAFVIAGHVLPDSENVGLRIVRKRKITHLAKLSRSLALLFRVF